MVLRLPRGFLNRDALSRKKYFYGMALKRFLQKSLTSCCRWFWRGKIEAEVPDRTSERDFVDKELERYPPEAPREEDAFLNVIENPVFSRTRFDLSGLIWSGAWTSKWEGSEAKMVQSSIKSRCVSRIGMLLMKNWYHCGLNRTPWIYRGRHRQFSCLVRGETRVVMS